MSNGKKDIVKIADGTTWIRAHMRWFASVLLNEWLHLDAGMESKSEVMNIITQKKIMQNIWTRAFTYFRNTFRCNIHFATLKCACELSIFMACRRNHAWIWAICVRVSVWCNLMSIHPSNGHCLLNAMYFCWPSFHSVSNVYVECFVRWKWTFKLVYVHRGTCKITPICHFPRKLYIWTGQKVWIETMLTEAVHKSQMWFDKAAIKFICWVNPDSAKV